MLWPRTRVIIYYILCTSAWKCYLTFGITKLLPIIYVIATQMNLKVHALLEKDSLEKQ